MASFVLVAGGGLVRMTTMAGRTRAIVEVNNPQTALTNSVVGELDEMAIAARKSR